MHLNSRPTVLLMGLGNIGFRHLQGLSPLADQIVLDGSDLSQAALTRAETEWAASPNSIGQFGRRIETRPAEAVVAILATSADGREALVRDVVERGLARALVLEKVVFNERAAFARTEALLSDRGATAVVNCARRLWPLYLDLAARVAAVGGPVHLTVRGRNLGFACNGVHFIDLLQMLSGEDEVFCGEADLSVPWAAKREGYFEVYGSATFRTPGGSTLTLDVQPDHPELNEVSLAFGDLEPITVVEASGMTPTGETIAKRAPYQSELTADVVAALMADRPCGLPSLGVSRRAHFALFDALEPAFARAGLVDDGRFPIT